MKVETELLHGDHDVQRSSTDVSPPITVSTTFTVDPSSPYSYSRLSQPNRARCERIIGKLEGGYALTYATGMASVFAAFAYYVPKRVLIGPGGYFVTHNVINLFIKFNGMKKMPLETPIEKGDLIWLETPKNPTCEIQDIQELCQKAHAVGAFVVVDSTFAPPPVQYTLKLGADMVMHSTTKYFAGHTDALGGVLVTPSKEVAEQLLRERNTMGNVPGNLESWLLLRSLRTLTIRVKQQCETASKLAEWLESPEASRYVERVYYPGLRSHPGHLIAKKQMLLFGGMLSIELRDDELAKNLPSRLKIFQDATSLGGVESLVDWRYKWDQTVSKRLVRVSVGLEAFEDLRDDFLQAFTSLAKPQAKL